MRNTLLAAVISATIIASLVVMVRPSSNEANAQSGLSRARAACILTNLGNAHTEDSVIMLVTVCKLLHG